MKIAVETGYRHADFLLDGVSNDQWGDMLAYWQLEPRGELRADYRSALAANLVNLPHVKAKKIQLDAYRLIFQDQGATDEFERVTTEYLAATADMGMLETMEYAKANYAPAPPA